MTKNVLTLMGVAVFIALLWACSTEAFDVNPQTEKGMFARSSEKPIAKDNLEAKLTTFVKEAESYKKNPAKSGETISIADAVFYTEGAVNFMNAHEGTPYQNLYIDSMFIALCADGEMLNLDEVLNAYNEFYQFAANHLQSINDKEKYVLLTDVEVRNQSKGEVELKITSVVAGGVFPIVNDYFTSAKFYGENKNCDDSLTLSDAQYLLQSKINNRHKIIGAHYFTNVDSSTGDPEMFPADNDGDNYNDYYLLYKSNITPGEMCLEVDELNFYLDGIDEHVIPILVPDNYIFRNCKINDFRHDYPYLEIGHNIEVWFGNLHYGYSPF